VAGIRPDTKDRARREEGEGKKKGGNTVTGSGRKKNENLSAPGKGERKAGPKAPCDLKMKGEKGRKVNFLPGRRIGKGKNPSEAVRRQCRTGGDGGEESRPVKIKN